MRTLFGSTLVGLVFLVGCRSGHAIGPAAISMIGPTWPVREDAPPAANTPLASANAEAQCRWSPPQGTSSRWTSIVIHHSGTTDDDAASLEKYHTTPVSQGGMGLDELGYHFVITNPKSSGHARVEVGPRWWKQKHGAHCSESGNWYNDHGIGICIVGDFDEEAPSEGQVAALAELIRFLMQQCGVPESRVYTHAGIGEPTSCPGTQFSLAAVLKRLERLASSPPDASPVAAAR